MDDGIAREANDFILAVSQVIASNQLFRQDIGKSAVSLFVAFLLQLLHTQTDIGKDVLKINGETPLIFPSGCTFARISSSV